MWAIAVAIAVVVRPLSVVTPGRHPHRGVRLPHRGTGTAAAAAVMLSVTALGAVEPSDHESRSGTSSSPAPACRDAAPHLVEHLVGHRATYPPPAFDCFLDDGATYPATGGYAGRPGRGAGCRSSSIHQRTDTPVYRYARVPVGWRTGGRRTHPDKEQSR